MRRWIVTLLGAGLLPKMPGTWGSLATSILLYFVLSAVGPNEMLWLICLSTGLVFFSILCILLGPFAIAHFKTDDPGPMVLDEAAGICLTLLFLPALSGWRLIQLLGAGFIMFRLFDVVKLPPARQLEHLPAGWGILLDDLAAAVYANIFCQFLVRFFLVRA
ncbi:MAG TPA: phosphatidylglycerophosphatase A [Tepidisphaeraceae bacterium]|nr:phosphatidylglycerophosphatase A [Tepidisphaeraceae bacterium]